MTTRLVAHCQALWATRDRGATAVEYGLMVALIAVVIITAVFALGGKLTSIFEGIKTSLDNPGGDAG